MYLLLLCILYLLHPIFSHVEYNDNMKSFSYAHKNGQCFANKEVLLYERTDGIPGVLTEQWFAGLGCFDNSSILRYYIDDEKLPSIEGLLYLMHGIGFYNHSSADIWGTKWMGQLAKDGGIYNTIRVPYQRSIRITLEAKVTNLFWYIVRGVENYPVIIGDVQLPSTARLRLQKISKTTFHRYQFITLANSQKNGLLFMVSLAANSSSFYYLEGCYRFLKGNKTKAQYLSSGTEDFYLSAYYYNKGVYHTEHSGLTYIQKPGTMSAYKIFAADPIFFKDSFNLIWRVSEKKDNACYTGKEECFVKEDGSVTCSTNDVDDDVDDDVADDANNDLKVNVDADINIDDDIPEEGDTEITSYVWFYEW